MLEMNTNFLKLVHQEDIYVIQDFLKVNKFSLKNLICILSRFRLYKFPKKIIMSEESINDRTKVIGDILSTKFEELKNLALGNTCDSGIPVFFMITMQ